MEILTQWCIVYSRLHMLQGPVLNACVNRSVKGEIAAEPKAIAICYLSSSVYCSPEYLFSSGPIPGISFLSAPLLISKVVLHSLVLAWDDHKTQKPIY